MSELNRIWRLRKRPVGDITDDVLSFEEESIPEPSDGEFLFRLNYLSLDPTNRIWMSDMDQYMPPVELPRSDHRAWSMDGRRQNQGAHRGR